MMKVINGEKNKGISRYMIALIAFALAGGFSLLLHAKVEYSSSALFLVAVMVTAWWAGRGPALVLTVLSSFFTIVVLINPVFSLALGLNGFVRIVVFIIAALIISSLTTRTIAAERKVREFNRGLEQRVRERTVQLHEANFRLRAFSYSVAHDLRAPMRAVQGFATALSDECGSQLNENAKDYLLRMGRAAERMDRLIIDLLSYSDLTTREVEPVPTDLDRCIDHVLTEMEHRIAQMKAIVEVQRPLGIVSGSSSNVELVMRHLMLNALQFVASDRTPVLEIWTVKHHDRIKLLFRDNGVGIPAEFHERIFGVFQTLQAGQGGTGTGIGLPLVKAAMLQIGGNVGVESSPGAGSLFWLEFKLPAQDAKLGREPEVLNGDELSLPHLSFNQRLNFADHS